jgi:isopenicillin-N epimerase
VPASRGTGIPWAPARNRAQVRPTIPTFCAPKPTEAWEDEHPPSRATRAPWVSPGAFKAHKHQWAMADAFRSRRPIDRKRSAASETTCKDGLARIHGVPARTPRDASLPVGITCLQLEGPSPQAIVDLRLQRKLIASPSPYEITRARLAPSVGNDERAARGSGSATRLRCAYPGPGGPG